MPMVTLFREVAYLSDIPGVLEVRYHFDVAVVAGILHCHNLALFFFYANQTNKANS